jgi:hypothetical protein
VVAAPPLPLYSYISAFYQQNADEEDSIFENLDEVRLLLLDACVRSFTNAFAGASIMFFPDIVRHH